MIGTKSARLLQTTILAVACGLCCPDAHGQCGGVWIGDGGLQALDYPANAVVSWDPPGPAPAVVVIGGGFLTATGNPVNFIAAWGAQVNGGGNGFFALDQGVDDTVLALAVYQGELVVGGNFTHAGGLACAHVAKWTGTNWHPLGGGVNGGVTDFAVSGGTLYAVGALSGGDYQLGGVKFDGQGNLWISAISEGCAVLLDPPGVCYANCDNSTLAPILNVNDFQCFLNKYATGDPSANCDGSASPPVLNVNDFICFMNKYAAGCP